MSDLLLGIDIGTYSSKGILVQPDGTVLKSHVVPHTMDIPQPGWAEQNADAVWWHDFVTLCRTLLDGSPYTGADVGGVAVSAIGPCMLPLNTAGLPLRPGILYGVDTRASAEIALLNQAIGEDAIFDFSGMALSSQAIGPKILWLKRNEPDNWAQVDRITTASSYLVYRLTGEHVIDIHTASHYMPLMDIKQLAWSRRFAEHVIDIDKLPRLAWSDERAGEVSTQGAAQTGLKPGTPVAVGAVDALSEALSVGVVSPGDLMIMYGSTAFFILVLDHPVPDQRTWTTGGVFVDQYNLAAGMATTGSLTRWFRDQLAQELSDEEAYDTLFEQAEQVPPGANGLLMLPYFSGERTPINDPQARGVIAGLALSHTRADLYRAALEGVAFGIRHNIDTFREMGAPVQRVVAVGGGTRTATWLQIVSDVANVAQHVPALTIGASYGDAFLAGLAAGILKRDDLSTWVKPGTIIEPNAERVQQYDRLFPDFLNLYTQTKEVVHRLSNRS